VNCLYNCLSVHSSLFVLSFFSFLFFLGAGVISPFLVSFREGDIITAFL
jgi:hypothetical protein